MPKTKKPVVKSALADALRKIKKAARRRSGGVGLTRDEALALGLYAIECGETANRYYEALDHLHMHGAMLDTNPTFMPMGAQPPRKYAHNYKKGRRSKLQRFVDAHACCHGEQWWCGYVKSSDQAVRHVAAKALGRVPMTDGETRAAIVKTKPLRAKKR
jgi:hypothetical protein